jgi:hypothetical protein
MLAQVQGYKLKFNERKHTVQETRGSIRITYHWVAFAKPLLPWKDNEYYTFCVCVCVCVCMTLVIQHAKRMRRIILSSVASPALQYFPTSSHIGHDFREKLFSIKYVFWFCLQLLFQTFLILRRMTQYVIINVHMFSRKLLIIHLRY